MVQYLKARLIDTNRGTATGIALIFKIGNASTGAPRFLLVSDHAVADGWTRENAQNRFALPGETGSTLSFSGNGYARVSETLMMDQGWMSITSFCSYLDLHPDIRTSWLGTNALDPVSILTCDAGEPFDLDSALTVSSSRNTTSPEISRTSATSVAILEGYTRTEIYTGFSAYHHNQRVHRFNTPIVPDKPWRIGVELEVYARSREAYNTITSARSNWFQCESDSSLSQASFPIELKTIPLRACDAKSVEFWEAPMRSLATLAKSKGYTSTGLHIHIGKEILGDTESERQETLNKLCWFYVYRIENVPDAHAKNVIIAGRERGYAGSLEDNKTALADFAEMVGFKAVAASKPAFDKMASEVKVKTQGQRWDINLGPYNSYGTIEFRKGDGRISKTRLAALVTWWEQMTLYCRNTRQDQLDFDEFFTNVCAEYPAVQYFFTQDEEA